MKINKKQWTASADFSGNYSGDSIYAERFGMGAIQVSWSGSPVGTLNLQMTADNDADTVVWTTIDTQATSGLTSHLFLISQAHGSAYRITFTSTSGTGTATIDAIWKSIDG